MGGNLSSIVYGDIPKLRIQKLLKITEKGNFKAKSIALYSRQRLRLQQYVNCELPDVQAGFRKGRGTRDQIANIRWIMEKGKRVPEKHLFLFY